MDSLFFKTKCGACNGTGINNSVTPNEPCQSCTGSGYISSGASIDISEIMTKLDDLTNKVDDVMDKCNDIFEKVSE